MNNSKIGFQFKKISKPKTILNNNCINDLDDVDRKEEIDFVTSIDDNTIQGTKPKTNDDYIIPLIKVNRYRIDDENSNSSISSSPPVTDANDEDKNDLLSRARQELINESKLDSYGEELLPAWKSLLINKLPNEFESDSKFDVSMRPIEPRLEDYERIPVNVYGVAMLRGMGWKEGDAIGGINKAVTPIIEPKLRPRGIGLGADISIRKQLEQKQSNKNDKEEILRKGCHVCIEFGPYKGYYGIVENISDDLIYARVKLTNISDNIQLPQELIRVVTKKEYDLESKVINKSKFDEYKNNESLPKEKSSHHQSSDNDLNEDIWIVPDIRVQIIDKKYKNGKYYKEKVIIEETFGNECVCTTKDKKTLNLTQSMLRTVIPSTSSNVMILRGKYRGQLAKIKDIDWKHNSASINVNNSSTKSISVSLDDISEFYK